MSEAQTHCFRWCGSGSFLPGPAPAMAGGSVVGGLVGRRDRRRLKCLKTWLGLDLALSVATGTPCLGKYAVPEPGPGWATWPRTPCRSSASASRAWCGTAGWLWIKSRST